jgi:hypothetical protein
MKSFKEFQKEDASAQEFIAYLRKYPTVLIFEKGDEFSQCIAEQILEEGRTYILNKRHSIRFDKAHVTGQQDHTHFMIKGREIGAINKDSSPSHGTDVNKIPQNMIKAAKDKGFIEESILNKDVRTLVENALFANNEELINEIDLLIEKI